MLPKVLAIIIDKLGLETPSFNSIATLAHTIYEAASIEERSLQYTTSVVEHSLGIF